MENKESKTGMVIFALAFLSIIASAMQVLIVPILGQLGPLLHTSSSNAAWAVTVTPLVSAIVVTASGRLGDMFGKRRLIFAVTVPMIVGLAVCGITDSLALMLIGRGLQGIAIGVVPLAISLLRDIMPTKKLGTAVAIISGTTGIGTALGLPIASAIAQSTSWHVMFLAFAVLAFVGLIFIKIFVPADRCGDHELTSKHTDRPRFDFCGTVLLALALVSLLLPISKGSDWGWTSPITLILFCAVIVFAIGWILTELRQPAPLTDLRTLARPAVMWTNIISVLATFSMYVQFLVFPQILELPTETGYGLGQTMLNMSLWYAPAGLMTLAVAPITPRLVQRFGPKSVLMIACIIIAVSYAISPFLIRAAWGVLTANILVNTGVGMAFGVIPVLLMSNVPMNQTAAVNGFNMLARNIGTSISGAVLGAVLSHLIMDFGDKAVPSLYGFHTALYIGCGAALTAAILGVFIKRTV